ncbi:MAG: DUF1318 domain-containing protein [Deltaproteobacteria bacterium]|jgi:hypothetical protein|nr:DUF1318 domain-containing protein [Deltaproteobacteria bacterium]MBW2668619.1 DUF1318 domain-containing protein [Deltaproteobacteria bacterium]MBW2711046.1 DUF1318 domain-containing protein [Deltaproteobacteria bacterium]
MKKFQKLLWTTAVVMAAMLGACVTINIYFPAEKVESVAGDIVNDIRGQEPSQKDNQSKNHKGLSIQIKFALGTASAWAGDVTTVSNPTIRALKEKMKARFQGLKAYYQKGALNEGGNGYLSVADTSRLNLKEKRDLNGLVDAENRDRKTLYAEVARALKIDSGQIDRIAEIFAKEWQKPVR